MKKIKFIDREHKNSGDCWCAAISTLLNKEYDEIYKLFKKFINNNGSINNGFMFGYLDKFNYTRLEYNIGINLYEALQVYDTSNGILIRVDDDNEETGHIIYVKDNNIYDIVEDKFKLEYLKNYKVTDIFTKIDDTFKYV